MSDQQTSDKQLQSFSLAVLPLEKLDAYASLMPAAHHRGVDGHGQNIGGNLQSNFEN